MSADQHEADRSTWDCKACGTPWPSCEESRAQLVDEHGWGTHLTLWMSIDMIDAARANPKIPPHVLYQRFVAWTKERPAADATPELAPVTQHERPKVRPQNQGVAHGCG